MESEFRDATVNRGWYGEIINYASPKMKIDQDFGYPMQSPVQTVEGEYRQGVVGKMCRYESTGGWGS